MVCMRDKAREVGLMSGDAGVLPGAQVWIGSNQNWSVFMGSLNMGRHKKAPVRCLCSRLADLRGAPRTLLEGRDWLTARWDEVCGLV